MKTTVRLSYWAAFSTANLFLVPALALAQSMSSGGFGGSSGGFGGNSISPSGTTTSFGGGASGFGGGNTGSNSNFFGGASGGNTGNTGFTGTNSPSSGGGRGGAGSVSNPVNQSNVLFPYFATGFSTSFNSSSLTRTMGSFGQPLYKISTPTASAQAAQLGTASVGGRGSSSSLGSANTSNANFGSVITETTRRPAVAAMLDDTFPVNVPSGGILQAELRDILDRSTSLTSQPNISISVEGRLVTLRGVVPNDNERRLAESLLRLTPGVGMIKNELTVRAP
jgi:BON domain